MATVAELVKRTRRWLNDEPMELYTTASVAATAADTTVEVADTSLLAEKNVLEFDDDTGEQVLVKSITDSTDFVVKREHNQSSNAAHASGTVLLKNPAWPYDTIAEAISQVVDADLWPLLYTTGSATINSVDLQASPRPYWFDLDALDMGLVSVSQLYDSNRQVQKYGSPGYPVLFQKNLPTGLVASGTGIQIPSIRSTDNDIELVTVRKITTTTIPDGTIAEVVVLGSVARLLRAKELKRGTQGPPQSEKQRPGSFAQSANFFQQEFIRASLRAQAELAETAPKMRVWNGAR